MRVFLLALTAIAGLGAAELRADGLDTVMGHRTPTQSLIAQNECAGPGTARYNVGTNTNGPIQSLLLPTGVW